jgi:hypothetical protein
MYAALMPSRAGEAWEAWEDAKLRDDLRWGCSEIWILAKRLRRSRAEVRLRLAEYAAAEGGRIKTLARSALDMDPATPPEIDLLARLGGPIVHSGREAALSQGSPAPSWPTRPPAAAGRALARRRASTRSGALRGACASEASAEVLFARDPLARARL